jgi:hypothetical protein
MRFLSVVPLTSAVEDMHVIVSIPECLLFPRSESLMK